MHGSAKHKHYVYFVTSFKQGVAIPAKRMPTKTDMVVDMVIGGGHTVECRRYPYRYRQVSPPSCTDIVVATVRTDNV